MYRAENPLRHGGRHSAANLPILRHLSPCRRAQIYWTAHARKLRAVCVRDADRCCHWRIPLNTQPPASSQFIVLNIAWARATNLHNKHIDHTDILDFLVVFELFSQLWCNRHEHHNIDRRRVVALSNPTLARHVETLTGSVKVSQIVGI